MKKRLYALLVFLMMFLYFLSAGALETQVGNLEGGAEKIDDVANKLTDADQRSAYLKQEWSKILEKSDTIKIIDNFMTSLNSVWKAILGLEYSFSWTFILTFVLWLFFLEIVFNLSSFVEPFVNPKTSKLYKLGLFIIIFFGLTYLHFSRGISLLLIKLFPENFFYQVIFVFVMIIVLVAIIVFSRKVVKSSLKSVKRIRIESIENRLNKKDLGDAERNKLQEMKKELEEYYRKTLYPYDKLKVDYSAKKLKADKYRAPKT